MRRQWTFQFTTSQGGRLSPQLLQIIYCSLSIHDLTRRSTTAGLFLMRTGDLSIHDLTRRSTIYPALKGEMSQLSIHDLTRRSTANTHKYREYLYKFFSILYTHPFLHTFILQFRITFPLCYSYIQCESLGIFCPLYIRTKELTAQSHQNWALFQYAPLCFYTYLPDYKIADCPIPCL